STPLFRSLFLIHFHESAIRIRWPVRSDHKTVGKRGNLIRITNPGHWAALRDDVFEFLYQIENLILTQWIRIFLFNPGDLSGNPPVHIVRRLFKQSSIRILQGILVHPYTGSEFISLEIFQGSLVSLV